MTKRIVALLIAASVISAGILYAGIEVLSNFGPALASSAEALVTGERSPATPDSEVLTSALGEDDAPVETAVKPPTTSSSQVKVSVTTASENASAPLVTVAEITRDPDQYDDRVFRLSGTANFLGDGKLLLNDGTGQILVDVDDDDLRWSNVDGQPVTVEGELDDDLELEACSLTYQGNTLVIDDCESLDAQDDDAEDQSDDDDDWKDNQDDDIDDQSDDDDDWDDDIDDQSGDDDDWSDDQDDDIDDQSDNDDDWDDDIDDQSGDDDNRDDDIDDQSDDDDDGDDDQDDDIDDQSDDDDDWSDDQDDEIDNQSGDDDWDDDQDDDIDDQSGDDDDVEDDQDDDVDDQSDDDDDD